MGEVNGSNRTADFLVIAITLVVRELEDTSRGQRKKIERVRYYDWIFNNLSGERWGARRNLSGEGAEVWGLSDGFHLRKRQESLKRSERRDERSEKKPHD